MLIILKRISLLCGDNIVTISGIKRIKYLEENFIATRVYLSPEESTEIRQIINFTEIKDARYN